MPTCCSRPFPPTPARFSIRHTRPGTFHAGAELVTRGANLAKICDEVYQSYPLSRARLLKHVYSKFRLTDDDRIAWFWLKKKDFNRTGAESDDTEGLIDHIRAIEPVVVACVFEELEPELTRISLRSKSAAVNVNEIAAAIRRRRPSGGGGRAHSRHAAGGAAQSHRRGETGAEGGEVNSVKVKVKKKIRGKIVRKSGLLVWTWKVPPIPLEVAVDKARHYFR